MTAHPAAKAQTCRHCGVLWLPLDGDDFGASQDPEAASPSKVVQETGLCPVCDRLGSVLDEDTKLPEVAVLCGVCGKPFPWAEGDQRRYLDTQERRWIPKVCSQCLHERRAGETEDLRALRAAVERLQEAYQLLKPSLRDAEKLSLRYQRVVQRAQWIVGTYGRYFPQDMVHGFQGSFGSAYPSSAFDETVPGKRAVLRLRAFVREILEVASHASDERDTQDVW